MNLLDFFKKKPASGQVAKDRLQLLLVSDRSACSPETMEAIRADIIAVLSKYMDIDQEEINIEEKIDYIVHSEFLFLQDIQ